MGLREDELRGEAARQVLESPIYVEAFAMVRDRIISQLESADLSDERRGKLNDLLVAHRKAHQYMEQVLQTGTLAAMEVERKVNMAQRVANIWR